MIIRLYPDTSGGHVLNFCQILPMAKNKIFTSWVLAFILWLNEY